MIKKFSAYIAFLALCAFLSNHAQASSWFVSPQLSTLGVGAQVGYRSDHNFSVRGTWNQYELHKSSDINKVRYRNDINMKSMGLLFDYYLTNSGFHVTAGLYKNDNKIQGNGYINGNIPVQFGNHTFHIDGKTLGAVQAKVEYAPIAPYLGVGYHNVAKQGFSFTADAGVYYQGKANATVTPPAQLAGLNDPRIKARTEKQERDIESKANHLRWYPVVSIGMAYTF